MRANETTGLLKETYRGWSEDEGGRLAAALAFYAIFAIAPLLIIVIEIGAAVLGGPGHHHVVRDQILNELRPAIGDGGTKAIGAIVQSTFDQRSKGTFATIVGWVLFAVAATGLIGSIQDALDTVWGAKASGGIVTTIKDRAKSFAIIAGVAAVAVALSAATAAVAMLGDGLLAKAVNAFVLTIVIIALTAALYKWLPKTRLRWGDVLVGAAFSGILSVIGQYLIGWYLGRGATTSAYGAAGSLVAVLLWMYYSAQIFLLGAEFTKAYAHRHGSKRNEPQRAQTGSVATRRFSRASSPSNVRLR